MSDDLTCLMRDVRERIHSRFCRLVFSDIRDEGLLRAYRHLMSYWVDSYRPTLTWLCNEICGGDPIKTISPSLVIYLTSAGIGIHDDIIDQSRVKQFQKTVPGLMGPDTALIAGDLLLVKGLLFVEGFIEDYDSVTFSSLIKVYRSYFTMLAEAEMKEVRARKRLDLEVSDYLSLLWDLSVDSYVCGLIGAITGGGSEEEKTALGFYGRNLGYLIRLRDEIKDVLNIEGGLKPRLLFESIPLALVYVCNKSSEYYREVGQIIGEGVWGRDAVERLLGLCYDVGSFDFIEGEMHRTRSKAIDCLSIFPDSSVREYLIKLTDLVSDVEYIK